MRLNTSLTVLALAGALAVAGCASTPEPEGGVRIDNQNYVSPTLNTVRVIDGSLARYVGAKYAKVDTVLDVERAMVTPTQTGFPRLTVQLRNKSDVMLPLEVRASWYDASGRPTDEAKSWTKVFLQPKSMAVFDQVSINTASAQYYVEVRGAQ
jgi:uncharacterized protein YcfL